VNEELLKLKVMLEGIQKNLEDGSISKEAAEKSIESMQGDIVAVKASVAEVMEKVKKRATAMDGLQHEKKVFSIMQVVRAAHGFEDKDNEYERSVCREYAERTDLNFNGRALDATTGTKGEYLVPPQAMTQMIDLLYAQTVVIESGATVLSNLVGSPVEIPKLTTGATAAWIAENTAITESEQVFGQVTLSPNMLAALVKMSRRLVALSNPGVEGIVQGDIVKQMQRALDLAALRGTGANNQPLGVSQQPNINTVSIGDNGGAINFDHLIKMEGTLEDDDAAMGPLGFIFHPRVKRRLKIEKVVEYSGGTEGAYRLHPPTDSDLENWLSAPFKTTTQIPINLTKGSGTALTEVYYGDWSSLLVALWGGMLIESTNSGGDAFAKHQLWVKATMEADIAVRHPESFCLINDAATAGV